MEDYKEEDEMSKLVSVIVPVYNVEEYLEECLSSIVKQTYKNIEIICVNDGSPDQSSVILENMRNKDDRIKIINQKNRGLSVARNAGMKLATGRYCYFCDSDDKLIPEAFQIMVDAMEKENLDILYFSADCFCDDDSLSIQYRKEKDIFSRKKCLNQVYGGYEFFEKLWKEKAFVSSVPIQCYRLDFLQKNSLFFSEGFIHEDLIYTYKAALLAERVMCIEDALYLRRVRQNSIVTSKITEKNFMGRFNIFYEVMLINAMLEDYQNDSVKMAMMGYMNQAYDNTVRIYHLLDEEQKKNIHFKENTINLLYDKMDYPRKA